MPVNQSEMYLSEKVVLFFPFSFLITSVKNLYILNKVIFPIFVKREEIN